ncbi:MAG TPA: hypothetical protein VFG69_12965 [Nannocystaceae bacterium]|nr:hypothetical protein [Nannocystaceae bacterium]
MTTTWLPREGLAHQLFDAIPENHAMTVVVGFAEPLADERAQELQQAVENWAGSADWGGNEPGFAVDFNGQYLSIGWVGVVHGRDPAEQLIARLGAEGFEVREVALGVREVDDEGTPGTFLSDPRVDLGADEYGDLLEADEAVPEDDEDDDDDEADDDPDGSDDDDDDDDAQENSPRQRSLMNAFWRSSFDAARPTPPVLDPAGMFSMIQLDDGSMVSERRCMMPLLPGIRVGYGLVDVEDREVDERAREVGDTVRRCLDAAFPAGSRPPVFNREADPDGVVDPIAAHGRSGYAFALQREGMIAPYPGTFRYREYELLSGLANAVKELALAPVIHWSRDEVYIVNLWEKA